MILETENITRLEGVTAAEVGVYQVIKMMTEKGTRQKIIMYLVKMMQRGIVLVAKKNIMK